MPLLNTPNSENQAINTPLSEQKPAKFEKSRLSPWAESASETASLIFPSSSGNRASDTGIGKVICGLNVDLMSTAFLTSLRMSPTWAATNDLYQCQLIKTYVPNPAVRWT